MKFDVAAFLSSPPVRIEPLSAADLVWALERSSRPLSRGILVNLVQTEHLPFHVAEAIRRMSRCEVWKWRHVNGFDRRYKTRCNHPLCPACTGRLARQEAERVWKLFNAAAGAPILFDDLTWLTVNIGYLPIGSSFKAMTARAKKAIRNMRNRKFPGTVWAMELEIQLQGDGQGKLHAHGLVWHPGVTRESIEEALRALFTEARAVCAKELRSRRIRREAKGAATYKADISLKVKGWGERTAAILVGLIASYESMRSRGRFGLRFEMGLRRRKTVVEMSTIQVDSVEELLSCRRDRVFPRTSPDTPLTPDQKSNSDLKKIILGELPTPLTVPAVMGVMTNAYSTIDDQIDTWKLKYKPTFACRDGCSHCCHQAVWVTEPEAIYIADGLRAGSPDGNITDIIDWIDKFINHTGENGVRQRHRLQVPCPFLHDNSCVIYNGRPVACRGLYSMDANLCLEGRTKDAKIPYLASPGEVSVRIRAAMISALFERGVQCRTLELNAAVRIALADPDAGTKWLNGESPFDTAIPDERIPDITELARKATGDL